MKPPHNQDGHIWPQMVSASISVVHVCVTLALSSLLARALSPHDFGAWASITAALAMLAIFAQMGLPDLLTRETAVSTTKNTQELWTTWHGVDRMLLPSLGAAMILAALLLSWLPGIPWKSTTIAVLLLHIPCIAIISLRAGAIRGLGLGNAAQFLTSVMSSVLTIIIILGIAAAGVEVSLDIAFSASLLSLALPLIFTQCIRDVLAPSPRKTTGLPESTRRALRRASLPMAGIAGLAILNSQTDVLMLSWIDSPEAAGLYQLAIQTAMVLALIRGQLGLAATGRVASLWAIGDVQSIARLSRSIALFSTMVSATALFLSFLFGGAILAYIFGEAARAAAPALSIICAAWTFASFFGIPGFCLMMSGHQSVTLKASAISFAINAFLNPVFIPIAGVIGASVTLMISVIFWHTFLWWKVRKTLGFDCSIMTGKLTATSPEGTAQSIN